MANGTEIVVKEQDAPTEPRNVFSFFFPKFKLEFPFLKPNPPSKAEEAKPNGVVVGGEGNRQEEKEGLNPSFVRFPKTQLVVPPPLVVECEESSTKTSNPIILWQVYTIGGIILLKWIWARWNERKDRGRSPDDENARRRDSDDGPPSNNE